MKLGKLGTVAKAVIAATGGLCTALSPLLADNVLDLGEIGGVVSAIAFAAATVAAVWRVPNKDTAPGTQPQAIPPATQ